MINKKKKEKKASSNTKMTGTFFFFTIKGKRYTYLYTNIENKKKCELKQKHLTKAVSKKSM